MPVDGAEALDGDVVQAEVEDRVHHPGHRDRRTRANGDEKRVAVVAEALSRAPLECRDVLVDLVVEARGDLAPGCQVRAAGIGRDREPVGDRDAELRHLGEADPLPAEELATAARVLAEVEDVAHLRGESTGTRQGAETAWFRGCPVAHVAESRAGETRVRHAPATIPS